MLVITRKKGEAIILGPKDQELARVVIVEDTLRGVRLGFEIPRDWIIHREEVWHAIQEDAKKEKDSQEDTRKNQEE